MALGGRGLNSVPVEKAEDEIMTDVRGSEAPGYVSNRPQDTVSSTGAQICKAGNIMVAWNLVLWLETACGRELDLISLVGRSEVQKRGQELKMRYVEM